MPFFGWGLLTESLALRGPTCGGNFSSSRPRPPHMLQGISLCLSHYVCILTKKTYTVHNIYIYIKDLHIATYSDYDTHTFQKWHVSVTHVFFKVFLIVHRIGSCIDGDGNDQHREHHAPRSNPGMAIW